MYVDFWVFRFTIHFRDAGNTDAAINLPAFWELLLQQPRTQDVTVVHAISAIPLEDTSLSSTVTTIPQVDKAHVLVIKSGHTQGSSKEQSIETKEGAPWIVHP
jgi:hypothetical protein